MSSELSPLRGSVREKKFLVLDIETKKDDGDAAGFERPFLVGVYDGESYKSFRDEHRRGNWRRRSYWHGGCIDQAMRYILRKRYRGYLIYGHNAGRFDYLHLMPWFDFIGSRLNYLLNVVPVASSIQLLKVWKKREGPGGRSKRPVGWEFLDSYKLIPISLDAAAKAFNLEGKLQHDLDLPESDPSWETYNEQDCVQLFKVMEQYHHYIEKVLGGEVKMTAASTAMCLLRRQYLDHPIPRNVETHEFVRAGYYGGRCEAYITEGDGLYYYDINSSYPNVMRQLMPGTLLGRFRGEIPDEFVADPSTIGFVRADVYVPEMDIPVLPVRGDGVTMPEKLLFPTGRLRGTWEWGELTHALVHGAKIATVYESVWYEGDAFFTKFIEALYPLRDVRRSDYDAGLAQVAKIMMNTCYGKTGQKLLRKKLFVWDDPNLPENAYPAGKHDDIDAAYWWSEEEIDAPYIMPQVAARVTALARVEIHKWMMLARKLGGRVYYCDTDSLITNVPMPNQAGELGQLKDEYPLHAGRLHGRFLGPKMYMLTDFDFQSVKYKGVALKRVMGQKALADLVEEPYRREPKSATETTVEWALRLSQQMKLDGFTAEASVLDQAIKKTILASAHNAHVFRTLEAGRTINEWRLEKIGALIRDQFKHGPRMYEVPRSRIHGGEKRETLPDGINTRPFSVDMWREECDAAAE